MNRQRGVGAAVLVMALVLIGVVSPVPAATVTTKTLQSAAGATGNGETLELNGKFSAVAMTVTISNTATVTFEALESGSTWVSLTCVSIADTAMTQVTSTTASGTYQCPVAGLTWVRARISAFTSGTVTVTATASDLALGKKGGGGSGGAPTDATYLVVSSNGTLSAEVAVGATDDATLVGNGTTIEAKVLPSCSNATTSKLLYNSTTNAFSCGTDQDSGAGSGMTHPQVLARIFMGF